MNGSLDTKSDFAPIDPTDGRKPGEWVSRYPKEAKRKIKFEAIYLGLILFLIPVVLILFLILKDCPFFVDPVIRKYSFAWLGGSFGGVLFSLKWLYHSVAKYIWNEDRRLWRLFTPHLSGGFSFAMVTLISSNLINIFDAEALSKLSTIFGIGFLTGYFSDYAIGKLSEVSKTLFGVAPKPETKKGD